MEILVWGDPEGEFARLNINPKCIWTDNDDIESMSVYELSNGDYETLCHDANNNCEDAENWSDCAWRRSDGSNMGFTDTRYNINSHYIKAWDGTSRENDIEYNKKLKPEDRFTRPRKYTNLLEYFCEEIGASQPRNICALAVDLAQQNNMTMGELFNRYQG